MNRPPTARLILGLLLLQTWLITGMMVTPFATFPHAVGPLSWGPATALLQPVFYFCIIGVPFLVSTAAFVWRRAELTAGLIIFAFHTLIVLMEMSVRQIFMPNLASMLSGSLLAAHLVVLSWGRWRRLDDTSVSETIHEVLCGVLGATLVLSALSKLWLSGLAWTDGPTQCGIIYEHAMSSGGALAPIRASVARYYALCQAGASGVLLIELGAVGLCVPAARKAVAVAIMAVFLALGLLQGIHEHGWWMMAVALAWSRAR